ncbi:amidohydrolase family protein [Gracilimonas sp.]|uniref:amidohydrolase family protein n=1 Tax=Gracilimonas sp. TaxID=1974203 RepID=UPI00287267A2|nr:amidohydrolase family protein [Gracilimonas sp.]
MKLHLHNVFKLVFILPLLFISTNLLAQSDHTGEAYPTRTFAITGATIIQGPGMVVDSGTVVISDGLISAVGTDVSIPADAEVIDGTELFVYPGFIDGMSNTGATRPDQMERPDNLFTPDPPNDYAGITPEESVISQLDVAESSIENMRKLGFTISHTVPYGRMLPGSGAIILLSDKDTSYDLVLKQDASMFTQFTGAPGAYPGNTLGIMAKWRNLYTQATYNKDHETLYASNPDGIQRPPQDRALQAFYPVIDKNKPVFYHTNSMLEARRAMKLKDELDFNLVLSDLEEGWFLMDDLRDSDIKVLMSLDLPDEPKTSEDDEEKSADVIRQEQRRLEAYNQFLSQYREFNEAGISYGFSTMGTTTNSIKGNLERLVAAGLSEDAALAALTTEAAKLLGIENIAGTLETGKLGNAIVTTAPYFEEDSKIKYVFVDGDKYEYDTSRPAGGEVSDEGMEALTGTWNYTLTSPQGEQTGQWIFSNESGSLTGLMTSNDGGPDMDMNNLSFLDGTLSFDFSFDAGGQSVEIVVVGDVTGSEFSGEASVSAFNMSIPITATKVPN